MASETPPFWWHEPGLAARLLWPASLAYAPLARRRFRLQGTDAADIAILCVASLAVGATGRTPTAIALARAAAELGLRPGFVSHGPAGGRGPAHLVDAGHDSFRHVGEEALELARYAPVAVSARRAAGARLLAAEGCHLAILLDGFAGARLSIDHVAIVVNAERGLGNGFVIPAGPLRAPLVDQLRHADSVILIGEGQGAGPIVRQVSRAGRPVYQAHEMPRAGLDLSGRRFVAFCGIGAPKQFHEAVAAAGGTVVASRNFAPGHHYTQEEAVDLVRLARDEDAGLVTTVRDAISIGANGGPAGELLRSAEALEIELAFENVSAPARIVEETARAWERRHTAERRG